MAKAAQASSTDSTGVAQGRFTVQLPAELKPMIAALSADATREVKANLGFDVELSMAQVVGGIVKAQHEVLTNRLLAERSGIDTSEDGTQQS